MAINYFGEIKTVDTVLFQIDLIFVFALQSNRTVRVIHFQCLNCAIKSNLCFKFIKYGIAVLFFIAIAIIAVN